jgi:pyridoxal phosphate-dependent aminotransferase EpsN
VSIEIYLSPPDVSAEDMLALRRAFDGGWIAPLGPEVDAFESELGAVAGRKRAVALSSGTAGLHLALLIGGVGRGDRVLVSDLTFAASANPVRYVDAEPVFLDSDRKSWNLDPDLLAEALAADAGTRAIKALIAVDLYGQCADYDRIEAICAEREVLLIEDAAEALGATRSGRAAGSFGDMAVLSFNGNKIITTSGGGALLTDDVSVAEQARFLATQARDPAPHYEHSTVGYNYRLSNLLAALGRSQLSDLARRVELRRAHNREYRKLLGDIPGVTFMPEAEGARSTFWLTAMTFSPELTGIDRDLVRRTLEEHGIEARPVWKPMHLQPLYAGSTVLGGGVAADLFERGLCLPSGSTLDDTGRERVIDTIRRLHGLS